MSHVHTLADRASDQGHMPTHSTAQPQICLDLKKKKKKCNIIYILADPTCVQGYRPTNSSAQPQKCLDLKKKNAILYIY